ncbi:5'-3' exoribonuclease 1 isoform X3 [Vanessa atalanta]|uniref:5'-3' exoribonuclease 1 isoform X3 n=1 Tax=Vanessa atalanta TaxID=42275 RepID=UPI001FCCF81C|nr:5'-3' exoribonuclease 1 isoform X3 [Vanessa atalanta]
MGVPKFFRYTSERYPCLNELVKQYQIPDFDNMYLDMNGIIHNCSHPDDSNPHFRITEEKIFKDIFHYISILFQIIRPKKLFFMAIDGVAPRAKMNQQRGRRFRSAREAESLEENAKAKGEVLPTEKRFDSNCITPGTVFMARLHEQLKYFVKDKISTDPLWSDVKVVLSGHETPGEGEHKIMDYIRWSRSQPDYNPNTRHCLYGLDADLIMLGMCTHEPHFALLREEVKFGRTTQRSTSPEETNFYLLHLSLLREYLEQEFISIKDKLPFEYDIEKIVDDWVLMGFLVGNDFIPHLPNMHISNDALPLLYSTYMTVLPTLNGYINEAGDLHLERFEIFMQELAKIDKEKFQDTYADLKYFEAKTGRRPNAMERKEYKPNNDETFNVNVEDIKANKPDDELQALINATQDMLMDDMDGNLDSDYEETSDEEANIEMEFILHKKDYYMNKLDYSKVTDEVLADQAEGYVRAIQWNLFYYYKGCPSWCWYYPHHYAPYISDIKGFKDLKIEFELGEPFKPFEQLLAVLPAASKHLLPSPFHDLMTDEDSPIVHYYPVLFETDLNGKKNSWEAVVLIPFIDETNLLSAMAPCYQRLTEEELKRNTHGPMLVYTRTTENLGPIIAPDYFSPIAENHAKEIAVWRTELDVPASELKRGMLPNVDRELLYPGFPTMRHLKYKTSLKKCKVKVFDQPSRNESMIVEIIPTETTDPLLEDAARKLLGKIIWVGWPHLTQAKVISVSNEKLRLHHIDKQNNNLDGVSFSTEPNVGNLHKQWISERSTIIEHNMNRLGIELGEVKVIVHALNLKGYKYVVEDNVSMALEEQWCTVSCGYALQATLATLPGAQQRPPARYLTPQQAYPPGDQVFLLTQGQYYGCLATVVSADTQRSGRIKVCVRERPEPRPRAQPAACAYRAAHHAAAACGISTQMLSRITGTVLVVLGERNDLPTEGQSKVNVGLNLKFNKKNQEVSGYTRRCKLSNSWLYSERCVSLVKNYAQQFPDLFDKLAYSPSCDVYFESDLWPQEVGKDKPQDVVQWLKSQPHGAAARRECGSDALEPEEMRALCDDLQRQLQLLEGQEKNVTLHVKWNLLYKPELQLGSAGAEAAGACRLYDRVVCVAGAGGAGGAALAGARGTVTAVLRAAAHNTVRLADRLNAQPAYQVMLDEPCAAAHTEDLFPEPRFYRMLPHNLLNISYGRKLREAVSETEPFNYGPPTVLRRDGHNSAFASYSPPRELKTPVAETRTNATNNNVTNGPPQPQDNATNLLRSLLKISESEAEASKKNHKIQNHQEPNSSWRIKNDYPATSSPNNVNHLFWNLFSGPQQQNWRKDNSYNRPQPYKEWTNSTYKPAGALPPFPSFVPPECVFPAHLPPPAWTQAPPPPPQQDIKTIPLPSQSIVNTGVPPSTNSADKLSNPFVPLQVQTSQRSRRADTAGSARPAPRAPPARAPAPPPAALIPQQQTTSRPQRKKKPRIAANLPFQMD